MSTHSKICASQRSEVVRFISDGLMLMADVFGDPCATTVLFLHGGGQSRQAWRQTVTATAAAGFRAIAIDLRGHGDSDWAQDGDYALDAYIRDVQEVLDQLTGKVVLVGASRGGQAALGAAALAPERVAALVLVDSAPYIQKGGVARIKRFFDISHAGFGSVDEAAEALSDFRQTPRRQNNSGLLKLMRKGDWGRLYWNWDPRTADPRFINPPSDEEKLVRSAGIVCAPTLLVRGALSDVVTPDSIRSFKQVMPGLEVIEVAGVGHLLTAEQNDIFAQVILNFLVRVT